MEHISYSQFGKQVVLPIAEIKEVKKSSSIFGNKISISYFGTSETVEAKGNETFVSTIDFVAFAISEAYRVGCKDGFKAPEA